ncbi:MAG: AbrB/MazE/SpoVT family DNA-binding domain-containing protein [Candidatus Nanoarchaeia archaeon]
MRRKVVLHGPSSLCVSLPSQWVKKNNILKGAELELKESENKIIISDANTSKGTKSTEVSFENMDNDLQKKTILSLYEKGFDEIKIKYKHENIIKNVHKFLNECRLGFEIISQTNYSFTLRNVAIPERAQFDDLFHRLFRTTVEYCERAKLIFDKKDDMTESGMLYASSVERIANYCKRIIVKENLREGEYYYSLTTSLVSISNRVNALYNNIYDDQTFSKDLAESFSKLFKILFNCYDLFYRFNVERYSEVSEQLKRLQQNIQNLKTSKTSECRSWGYVDYILKETSTLLSTVFFIKGTGHFIK